MYTKCLIWSGWNKYDWSDTYKKWLNVPPIISCYYFLTYSHSRENIGSLSKKLQVECFSNGPTFEKLFRLISWEWVYSIIWYQGVLTLGMKLALVVVASNDIWQQVLKREPVFNPLCLIALLGTKFPKELLLVLKSTAQLRTDYLFKTCSTSKFYETDPSTCSY